MRYRRSGCSLRPLRALFAAGTTTGLTDSELLERYATAKAQSTEAATVAETAFAALVDRHGAMVWGVCHRVLGDAHEAEDAFQATFLILVRKARSVRVNGSLGGWLYGVAHRVALRARSGPERMSAAYEDVIAIQHELAEISRPFGGYPDGWGTPANGPTGKPPGG